MKIYLDSGETVELCCQGMSRLWHHCYWSGIHVCTENGCPYWRDKDWLCKVMCE